MIEYTIKLINSGFNRRLETPISHMMMIKIGNTYLMMITHVLPTLILEFSFRIGMSDLIS